MTDHSELEDFLYHRRQYRGHWTPENLTFNANLQEFAERVSYISCLETNGKITPQEAYASLRHLWKQLKASRKHLGIPKAPKD